MGSLVLASQSVNSVTQSAIRVVSSVSDSFDPMVCSMPDFPAHHQLLDSMDSPSIELVMPYNHLILCCPLLLLPLIFPSIKVFSNEPVLRIRWPEYWSFSFRISSSSE